MTQQPKDDIPRDPEREAALLRALNGIDEAYIEEAMPKDLLQEEWQGGQARSEGDPAAGTASADSGRPADTGRSIIKKARPVWRKWSGAVAACLVLAAAAVWLMRGSPESPGPETGVPEAAQETIAPETEAPSGDETGKGAGPAAESAKGGMLTEAAALPSTEAATRATAATKSASTKAESPTGTDGPEVESVVPEAVTEEATAGPEEGWFCVSGAPGIRYYPADAEDLARLGLTDTAGGVPDFTKEDLGPVMGVVGGGDPALAGKTAYHHAALPDSRAICILLVKGRYIPYCAEEQ